MRRLPALTAAAMLGSALLLSSPAAADPVVAASVADDAMLLATEGGEGGSLPGPSPMGPNQTENPGRPTDYGENFLWAVSFLILVPLLLLVPWIGLHYYLRVWRPRHVSETQATTRS